MEHIERKNAYSTEIARKTDIESKMGYNDLCILCKKIVESETELSKHFVNVDCKRMTMEKYIKMQDNESRNASKDISNNTKTELPESTT